MYKNKFLLQFILDVRLDYRISCLLSIFRREFDDSEKKNVTTASTSPLVTESTKSSDNSSSSSSTTTQVNVPRTNADGREPLSGGIRNVDLEAVGAQAEGIFSCKLVFFFHLSV